jgi:FMN phosphatase YigB (HAD superfamily)
MLKAILFDLDNTLIMFDELEFLRQYLPKVSRVFSDIMPFEEFRQRILSSTQALIKNAGRMSNADFFMDHFCHGIEGRRDEFWDRFITFYTSSFEQFRRLTTTIDGVRELFERLEVYSLKCIIASNPFWPRLVQKIRLTWAGLNEVNFDLITDIENTSFCKPHLGYYREICENIHVAPEECLMVGNDWVNDMIASKIGMKTYLTMEAEDRSGDTLKMSRSLRNDMKFDIPEPNFKGSVLNVTDAVEKLMDG